jgi:hypothetical protein
VSQPIAGRVSSLARCSPWDDSLFSGVAKKDRA